MFLLKLTTLILFTTFLYGEEKFKKPNLGYTDIEKLKSGTEPFFEVWDEDNAYGVLDVAMDGTVLMFSLQGDPHPDKRKGSTIFVKRSEDGGSTWSENKLVGKRIDLDWKALGIGPYDLSLIHI